MRAIVTGANGQLGHELCRQLGSDALPLGRDKLDLARGPAIRDAVVKLKPDLLINCAAYTNVDRAETESEDCNKINSIAVAYLAEACGGLDCPLIQISTDYVFFGGKSRTAPYREEERPNPAGVYATSKLEGEKAAARNSKHLIVRTCGLYASPADRHAGNFVKTMLRLGLAQPKIRVVADQHCTPSYVPHVARAILFLAGYNYQAPAPWGIYHVTNTGATTWYDFAVEIMRQAGMDTEIEPISASDYGAPAPRPAFSELDTSKYKNMGGPPMPDWKAALAEYFSKG